MKRPSSLAFHKLFILFPDTNGVISNNLLAVRTLSLEIVAIRSMWKWNIRAIYVFYFDRRIDKRLQWDHWRKKLKCLMNQSNFVVWCKRSWLNMPSIRISASSTWPSLFYVKRKFHSQQNIGVKLSLTINCIPNFK